MKNLNIPLWVHGLAQFIVQFGVIVVIPEPAGKWVQLAVGLAGAYLAWYDKTHAQQSQQ